KMKDWAFNRQRYWGEPIPIVHCPHCGMVPVPYEELPLRLPPVENFEPGSDGESPLAKIDSYVNCKCPKCGADARRETDTMPQWAGSSWYFLRYCDPNNSEAFASKEALDYWMPVDWYNGGMEHVTRHMIYSRFWHKFLYDIGEVPCAEPYAKRTAQGLILGPDGEKMSKSKGNVVDPNDVVDVYGADVLRVYVLFMGDYEQAAPWSENSMKGCKRFLDRVWALQDKLIPGDEYRTELMTAMHKTIKKVTGDIEAMKFNTAIAAMMALVNNIYETDAVNHAEYKTLLTLLNPFAPHMTEELYSVLFGKILSEQSWPGYDEAKTVDDEIEIVLQINGKVKEKIMIPAGLDKPAMEKIAMDSERVQALTEGKTIVKVIAVPGKLVNVVVK
ncbi:MAG: class I tRNA ligase family protein, partial [Oscillospiraceae bacterium]|nr:class I tRNA ligase family protein [Oscillospiraceae bacterium]